MEPHLDVFRMLCKAFKFGAEWQAQSTDYKRPILGVAPGLDRAAHDYAARNGGASPSPSQPYDLEKDAKAAWENLQLGMPADILEKYPDLACIYFPELLQFMRSAYECGKAETPAPEHHSKASEIIAAIRHQLEINVQIAEQNSPEGPIIDGKRVKGLTHSQDILAQHIRDHLSELELVIASPTPQQHVEPHYLPAEFEEAIEEFFQTSYDMGRVGPSQEQPPEAIEAEARLRALIATAINGLNPLAPPPASHLRLKPLEWRKGYCDERVTIQQASNGWLYQVRILDGVIWLDWPDRAATFFPSEAEAKAAAQTDYERRILSAFSAPAPQPHVLAAFAEIERLRLATDEGTLAKRADRMWEIACEMQGHPVPGAATFATSEGSDNE